MPDDPESAVDRVGTPQAAALAWVEAVMDAGDLARAWPRTDPTLRLVLVQEWLWQHRDDPAVVAATGRGPGNRPAPAAAGDGDDSRDGAAGLDALAAALAQDLPHHPLWERFAADRVATWRRVWRGFGSESWVTRAQPEVVDLDVELVTFVEWAAAATPGGPAPVPFARRFLLRHTGHGWMVAGLHGTQRFRPGWPPAPA